MPDSLSPRLRDIVEACAAGAILPNIALMRIHIEAPSPASADAAVRAFLGSAIERPPAEAERLRALARLHAGHADAWSRIRGVLDLVPHDGAASPAEIAAGFDAANRLWPEAAAALYGLGDAELLAAATGEIVAELKRRNLLERNPLVLDLGCGSGRLSAPLAGEGARVVGVDVSAAMLASARRRTTDASFVRTSGHDLACLADGAFDLVVAVDAFPYLVQAGLTLAARHVAEAARLLKAGGTLLIFNFSYRGNPAADARDATAMAQAVGFRLVRAGERPFRLWDGAAYEFRRA